MELVSYREYARRKGVSLPAVQKALQRGRIAGTTQPDGRLAIDWVSQEKEWEANAHPSKTASRGGYGAHPAKASETAVDGPSAPSPRRGPGRPRKVAPTAPLAAPPPPGAASAPAPPQTEGATFNKAKTANEVFKAQKAELELKKMRGELLDTAEVRKSMAKLADFVKSGLMAIPDRVSAEFAGLSDAHMIHTILTREINQAMEELNAATTRA